MKLFLKRETTDETICFTVLDESAVLQYSVRVFTDKNRQKLLLQDSSHHTVSEILHKNLVVQYFALRCCGRFYVLLPYQKECFAFAIYGSTYRFLGNLSEGRFSLIDVDTTPLMTMKKCWGKFGDGYELELHCPDQEIFALSCAVCTALFVAAAERSTVLPEGSD